MILKSLSQEFEHEVNSTRKLLQAVREKDLGLHESETTVKGSARIEMPGRQRFIKPESTPKDLNFSASYHFAS